MNTILDEDSMSNNLRDYNFRGKLAGKSWKHQQALDRITMAQRVIFVFALALFYPIFINYLVNGLFHPSVFSERVFLSVVMIICGFLMKKFRIITLLVALLPVLLILYLNVMFGFTIKQIGFNGATFILICVGVYYHFQEIKIRKELILEIRKGGGNVVKI